MNLRLRSLLYIFCLMAFAPWAHSHFDLQAQAVARSYPESGIFGVTGGWNQLLWERDEDSISSTNWKYGYVRPWVQLQSIGITHRGTAEIEIFPISILGLGFGHTFSERSSSKNSTFDCDRFRCDGAIHRSYLKLSAILGAGNWAWMGNMRFDTYSTRPSEQLFVDESSNLLGAQANESGHSSTTGLFYRLKDNLQSGLIWNEHKMIRTQNSSRMLTWITQYRQDDWKYSLGIGQFSSTHQEPGLTILGQVAWVFSDSIGLLK